MRDAPARQTIAEYIASMELAPVNHAVVHAALQSPMRDFEDAVLAHAAAQTGADAIVTRNLRDFAKSPVRALSPEQWLAHPD
jgi:predicted nucleic acid-binding protein